MLAASIAVALLPLGVALALALDGRPRPQPRQQAPQHLSKGLRLRAARTFRGLH
jgi:hypothetical protein